jgi:hypothetical protein
MFDAEVKEFALQHKVILVYFSHGFRAAGYSLFASDPD